MAVASCASISASSLGLPQQAAMPESKASLPKQMFYAKTPVSSGLKQRFVNDIKEITVLGVLNASNTGTASEGRLKEILIIGVLLNTRTVPVDALEHIAKLRPSGILFVCVSIHEGVEECALAVRRARPGRAGHVQQNTVYVGEWRPASETRLALHGDTIEQIWESLNAQAILGSSESEDLDARIARRENIAELRALDAKLTKDHARAKNPTQRNEIYAKLHKARTQLASLEAEE
ncbi:DUF4391 domain-containing protein [Bifidobacterium crudilactis]|jgi:hypothetical protein|uniref:DUF4391 domain-containing protein n=1 Tax=Bifidobacterium crudilactis TaxID=327277 RepID=UPI003A5C346B